MIDFASSSETKSRKKYNPSISSDLSRDTRGEDGDDDSLEAEAFSRSAARLIQVSICILMISARTELEQMGQSIFFVDAPKVYLDGPSESFACRSRGLRVFVESGCLRFMNARVQIF